MIQYLGYIRYKECLLPDNSVADNSDKVLYTFGNIYGLTELTYRWGLKDLMMTINLKSYMVWDESINDENWRDHLNLLNQYFG